MANLLREEEMVNRNEDTTGFRDSKYREYLTNAFVEKDSNSVTAMEASSTQTMCQPVCSFLNLCIRKPFIPAY
jgi:hypothetical protein